MGNLRGVDVAALSPSDPIPFSSGWINTAKAARDALRTTRAFVLGTYIGLYFLLVLVENLMTFLSGQEIPSFAARSYLGITVSLAQAVSAHLMMAGILGEPISPGATARACGKIAPSLAITSLIGTGLIVGVNQLDEASVTFVLFWALGPPMLVQTIVIDRVGFKEAWSRTRLRLKRHGAGAFSEAFIVAVFVLLLRGVVYRAIPTVAEWTGGLKELLGVLTDALLRGVVSGASLAFTSALWVVGYVNARSLTEGSDTTELRKTWRSGERMWPT